MSALPHVVTGEPRDPLGGTTSVIDLGEVPPADLLAGEAGSGRLPARLLLLVAAVLTLLLPASVPPAGPPLPQLFTVAVTPNPQYLIDRGALYVSTDDALAGYRLADGRRLWRTPLPSPIDWFTADSPTRSLITMSAFESDGTVQVFDMDTGLLRWTRTGVSGQAFSGGDTIVLYDTRAISENSPVDVSAVNLRTGAVQWRRTLDSRSSPLLFTGGRAAYPTGCCWYWTTRAWTSPRSTWRSGAALRQVALAAQRPELASARFRITSGVVGDLLLVSAQAADGPREYAFDVDTLALRWSVLLPARTQYAGDCAPLICLYGDGGTTLLDPATGRVHARGDWQYAVILPDGRLLAQSQTITVVDGQLHPVLPLGLWQVIATTPVTVLARPGRNPDSTWIGVLDAGRDEIRPLAELHLGIVESCGSDGTYLVCRAGVPGLVIFRLSS